MKILSLFLFIEFTATFVLAQNPIQASIKEFIDDPALKHSSVSFAAADVESGELIASFHPDQSLPTASTAKLLSTATALRILGPNYRAKTKLYYDGIIDSSGVLHGNIWIRGGGDPAIGSKYFNNEENQLSFFNAWITVW